jgi:hypothetical protein
MKEFKVYFRADPMHSKKKIGWATIWANDKKKARRAFRCGYDFKIISIIEIY